MRFKCALHFRVWIGLGVFFWGFQSSSFAARLATVGEDGASLYETPNQGSALVQKLLPKTELVASNLPTHGFHKVRTTAGVIGWVQADQLILQPPPTVEEVTAAGGVSRDEQDKRKEEEKKEKKIFEKPRYMRQHVRLEAMGGMNLFAASGIVTGFDNITEGYSYGADLAFFLSSRLALCVRIENIIKSIALTDSATGRNFQFDLTSLPVTVGLELTLIQGTRASVRLSVLGGSAMQVQVKSTNRSDFSSANPTSVISTNGITGLGILGLNWFFSKYVSAFFEGGYRYLTTTSLNSPIGSGSQILNSNFIINLSGIYLGAGVALSI